MKRILIATLVMLCALLPVQGQTSQEANKELNEGAAAYKAGNFAEAQRHFEKALQLDPSHKNAQLFTARAIHAQYRPGVDTPENTARAQEAIEAYKKVLESNPDDHNAYNSVAYLYRQLKDEEKETAWLMTRATSETVPKEKRSDAYTVLASKQWNCSYDITERKENKEIINKPDAVIIQFKKPKDQADFDKAQQCVARGMELIEQAITLNPENLAAWSYKTNLLREMGKFAQMEGNPDQKSYYDNQAEEALAVITKLSEQAAQHAPVDGRGGPVGPVALANDSASAANMQERIREQSIRLLRLANDSASAANVQGNPSPEAKPKKGIFSAGVLNGKAISKPAPSYPEEAKAARASGTVTVQVVVDEAGNVISASAVDGHPLLQKAAVAAARQSTFSPTILSGQLVKVSGVITYNFVLQ